MSIRAAIGKRVSPAFSIDIEMVAPPGITILFGASGSGKSTILRCLAGLLRPDGGRITIGETVVFDSSRGIDVSARRRRVGFVFQQLALFPHMTVAENIAYGLDGLRRGEQEAQVTAIANAFRLTGVLHRRPAQVSGGERQRTALAR